MTSPRRRRRFGAWRWAVGSARVRLWSVAAPSVVLLSAGAAGAQKRGGVLRVGNLGAPPALDAHWTTASITGTPANHLSEGLSLAVPNHFAAIYPKEIAEEFPPERKITERVGAGPFKLVEWRSDQYLRMVRFDDYRSRSEPPNGYGGGETA